MPSHLESNCSTRSRVISPGGGGGIITSPERSTAWLHVIVHFFLQSFASVQSRSSNCNDVTMSGLKGSESLRAFPRCLAHPRHPWGSLAGQFAVEADLRHMFQHCRYNALACWTP